MYKKLALILASVFVFLFIAFVIPFVSPTSVDKTLLNLQEAPALLNRLGFSFYFNYYKGLVSPTPAPKIQFPEEMGLLGEYLYSDLKFDANTRLALLSIKSIDKQSSLFDLHLEEPSYPDTAGARPYSSFNCTQDKTYMVSDINKEYLGMNVDLIASAEPNDSVITYCQNDDCTSFGGSCILIKNSQE